MGKTINFESGVGAVKGIAKDRVQYHIEEYGKIKDRASYIARPAVWPRIEPCLKIIKEEREIKGKPLRVLDIGCSDGTVSKMISDMDNEVFGVDLIPHYVEQAKSKGIKAEIRDVEKGLPYENEFFDIAYAAVLLEHIFDTEFLLKETWRVLKKNGLFIASVPNIATLPNRIRILLGLYPKYVAPAISWPLGGHVRVFSASTLEKLLKICGFEVERFIGNYVSFVPASSTVRPWSRFLGKVFPTLSDVLIVSARAK